MREQESHAASRVAMESLIGARPPHGGSTPGSAGADGRAQARDAFEASGPLELRVGVELVERVTRVRPQPGPFLGPGPRRGGVGPRVRSRYPAVRLDRREGTIATALQFEQVVGENIGRHPYRVGKSPVKAWSVRTREKVTVSTNDLSGSGAAVVRTVTLRRGGPWPPWR